MRDAVNARAVRAIVVRGAGRPFSVGGDLRGFRDASLGANLCDDVARTLHACIEMMQDARQPVVGAVHGAVGGGGNGLVFGCDIVLAAESTVYRLGYTGRGPTPDCGVTWHLPLSSASRGRWTLR